MRSTEREKCKHVIAVCIKCNIVISNAQSKLGHIGSSEHNHLATFPAAMLRKQVSHNQKYSKEKGIG